MQLDDMPRVHDGIKKGLRSLMCPPASGGDVSVLDPALAWDVRCIYLFISLTKIGSSTFCGCSALTAVTLPDSLTSIGYRAFCRCSTLTAVTLPDSLTSIGEGAFSNCSALTTVTLPDSLTSIDNGAFDGCPLDADSAAAVRAVRLSQAL